MCIIIEYDFIVLEIEKRYEIEFFLSEVFGIFFLFVILRIKLFLCNVILFGRGLFLV